VQKVVLIKMRAGLMNNRPPAHFAFMPQAERQGNQLNQIISLSAEEVTAPRLKAAGTMQQHSGMGYILELGGIRINIGQKVHSSGSSFI